MSPALLYAALCAPLTLVAIRVWSHWARRGGGALALLGIALGAAAVDAGVVLLRLIEDTPGGFPPGLVGGLGTALLALPVLRAWRALGDDAAPGDGASSVPGREREVLGP